MNGAAQLIDMVVILDNVAIGAGVESSDGGIERRERGHQNKKRIRRNFLCKFQEIDPIFPRHTDVRNDDVEDLGFKLALGRFHAVGDFHAVPFLAKGNLQELANGFLIVHDEDMGQLPPGFLNCCFRPLHNTSRNSRQFDNKFCAAVLLRDHTDFSTVRLNDLIDNR